jgi:4'-phosphopantetheinyl transferase
MATTLEERTVHVWCRRTIAPPAEDLARAESVLSPTELARAARFVHAQDRCDYVLAHALLRDRLSACAGVAPAALRFATEPTGKPRLALPQVSSLAFSLSHTRGMAACALGTGCEVGVDIESYDHTADDAIAELALSMSERQALAELAEEQRSERLLALWTLKEAYLKATGEGLGGPLDRVAFAIDGDGGARLSLPPLVPGSWRFALLAPSPGYTLAVACRDSAAAEGRVIVLQPLT